VRAGLSKATPSERGHAARSTAGIDVVEVVGDDGRLGAGYRGLMVERTIRALGIPWYRREDWNALLALFVDREKFPATYDGWLRRAGRAEKEFKRQGTIAERVYIDPIEFSLWCVDRDTDLDAAARMKFAAEAVARKY
jgi:hypothetical protein